MTIDFTHKSKNHTVIPASQVKPGDVLLSYGFPGGISVLGTNVTSSRVVCLRVSGSDGNSVFITERKIPKNIPVVLKMRRSKCA